uniref:Thyroid hormone receptor associated protein complex subunit n=1 Tax=Rhipicephalus zambeziensis TaxID=60191 RepID=A0A224Z103_9ACAR
MGGVSYDPRWVAMGAGGPYLGQLGMGPLKALGGQRPPEPEGGTSYPSAEDRPYESREARPLECWPPGAGRPAPPQADRPAQALAPPMAPPHVSPGGPYDNWRPSVAPVYYGSQVPDFGRAAASYDQRLDFPPKRPDKEETSFDSRSRGDSFRKERDFEDKQQREKRESRDAIGAWSSTRDYDQRVPRDKWERETQPSRPDSRDSRTSRDSLRDERAMPPADQRQEMPLQQMEPHRIAAERVKDKPQVPDWSDTPYSAPGESKRRDWHTHHPPPVTQQQLDSAGPSKKNFVPLRRGGVAKDDGKDDVKEGKVEENSRADEDKTKEAAKKDDAEKRMPASRSRGGSGGRFEANRGRGGRGGNGYSSGNVGYRGRSREYRRSRTERGPRFDRKKDDGSEESSGVEEEKPTNRLRPKDEESEGSEEACPESDRKNRTAKEAGRAREPRRDEAKNKEEKSAFSPRGEPSRRGRGGAMSLGRSSRGRYQAGGYGPPTLKAPFGKPEDGNKEEEVNKEGSANQGSKPRSNSSRPVVRRPNRMEPLPPRFQKNQPRRQDNPERNKGRGGRGAGPSKDALSDVANEDWETASESSDVADRRGFDEGVRQQSSGSKKGPPTSSKAPGGGQERRRSGGEVRRGGGGAPGDRNGRGPVQRRDSGGGGPPARMGRGSGSRPGGRSRQQQQQRPGDVSAKGEPSQATMVYRMDEVKLQDPVGVQAALTDIGARKHIKKSEQAQPNGKLEKEKPNALEGIDLSNYASVVVIDDHPAVTDPSLCDGDDGDFQEVTSKKRHKVLTEGDSKKKKETRSKTSVHGRQNKLPPRLIKKRESDRLFSSKTECQLPVKTDGSATDSADTSTAKPQQHCTFSTKELAPTGVLRPMVNAWEKPITHALRGGSPPSAAPQSISAPAVSSADVLVSSKSSSFDRSSDQHDSGIDVSDQPASAASSQRSSPSNDGKAPLLGTSPKGLAAIPVGVPPSAGTRDHAYIKAVGVDSGKPMGTVIFENKNFKAENAALDKFESQTKSQEPGSSNAPMLPPVAPKAPNDTVEPSKCKGEDTVDMKLDFTFDSELAQFSDEKQAKHIAITRSLSSEITSANSPISPSTDDLNLKIASVKKVWENVGPLPTVLEHSAVSVAGDDTGSAAVQAPSFGSFGGSASSDTSFVTSSAATESMAQQGQTEPTQATSEAAFGSVSPLKPATASSLSHHVASVVGAGHHTSTSGHPHHPHHNHHLQQQPQQQPPVQPQQHLSLAVHHHHSQAHGSLQTPQQQQQQQQAMMRQTHQAHTMLDQQNLSKVRALHALSPPPTAASSLAGLDVRAMANLQVAGMPQAVASPPAALLFTSTQQMTQPAALYQTLLQDPVPRPVAHQFSQATHGYPAPPPYQSFNQGGMFVPPPPTHSGPDMFAATGAALRLQPTYQTGPTSQVLGQQSLPTAQQLLGSGRAAPGGAPLGTSYYPSQGGYYPSQQQNQALAFGSQPPLHRTFHPPPFKSLELATDFGATPPPKAQANKAFPPGSPFAFGQGRQSAPPSVATTGATPPGSSLRPSVHVLPLPANLVRGTPPTAPTKYPAPIQRPQQGLTLTSTQQPRGPPAPALRAQQPPARQLPTSDQQAKQQAEAVKQAQLFFAQSKPAAPEPTTEDVVNESSDDKAPKEAAEE